MQFGTTDLTKFETYAPGTIGYEVPGMNYGTDFIISSDNNGTNAIIELDTGRISRLIVQGGAIEKKSLQQWVLSGGNDLVKMTPPKGDKPI